MDRLDKIGAIAVFCLSFLFYLFTLAPTVLWGDSAKLALYVYNFYLPFELTGGHVLHTIIGKLFSYIPIGDFAYRQNLMSAFFGSATLLLLFFIMRCLGIGRFGSMLAVFGFAVSHTFWLVSVVNESYTLALFFISCLLLIFVFMLEGSKNKFLLIYLSGFLFSLSLFTSVLPVFLLLGFLYFFILEEDKKAIIKRIIPISLSFVAGSFLFAYLFFKNGISLHVSSSNLVSNFMLDVRWFVQRHNLLKEFIKYPAYLFYQFPFFGFFIGLIGTKEMFFKNRKLFWLTLMIFISYILFGSSYLMQRKFYILSVTYFIFSIYIGFGIDYIHRRIRNKQIFFKILIILLLMVVPVVTYRLTPALLHKININPIAIRTLPYRDNLYFYLWPNKRNEYGARRYAEQALQSVKPNSLILEDFTPGMVLRYLQSIEGVRKDVTIEDIDIYVDIQEERRKKKISEGIDKSIERSAVYLADVESCYEADYLRIKYDVVEYGVLYEVRKR